MKTILIVSYTGDEHATFVQREAKKSGFKVVVFDSSVYPASSEISFRYDKFSKFFFRLGKKMLNTGEICGVWWRRPNGLKKTKKQDPMDLYINLESEMVIRSVRDFLPKVNWISDPEATRLACRKPVQLQIAQNIGLKIPETCITNSPTEFKSFLDRLGNKQLTMKPVGTALMRLSPNSKDDSRGNRVVFTKVIDPKVILSNIHMIRNCPVIFQEAIKKDCDIRVTVIDNDVFAAEIVLDGCKETDNLDWRNYAGKRIYKKHILPNSISKKCVKITKLLGLRFGCIDLAFSSSNGYTFFEINPQGQWLPSQLKLGYTISRSLINSLTS